MHGILLANCLDCFWDCFGYCSTSEDYQHSPWEQSCTTTGKRPVGSHICPRNPHQRRFTLHDIHYLEYFVRTSDTSLRGEVVSSSRGFCLIHPSSCDVIHKSRAPWSKAFLEQAESSCLMRFPTAGESIRVFEPRDSFSRISLDLFFLVCQCSVMPVMPQRLPAGSPGPSGERSETEANCLSVFLARLMARPTHIGRWQVSGHAVDREWQGQWHP